MGRQAEGLRLRKVNTKPGGGQGEGGSQGDAESEATALPRSYEEEDAECPMSPVGRLFLNEDMYTVIVCALELEQRMELHDLQVFLRDTLARHPRFRSTPDLKGAKKGWRKWGGPWWVPAEVDIEYHVKEGQFTEAEAARPETALGNFMGRMTLRPPFEPSRPLWEAVLLHPGLPGRQSAIVFRIHHALGDGTSLMSLVLAATRQTNNPTLLPVLPNNPTTDSTSSAANSSHRNTPHEDKNGDAAASSSSSSGPGGPHMPSEASSETLNTMAASEGMGGMEKAGGRGKKGGGSGVLSRLWAAAAVAVNTLRNMAYFTAVVAFLPDTPTVLTALPGLKESPRAVSISAPISLMDISLVRKAVGATVNDVLIAVLALAVERYVEQQKHKSKGSACAGGGGSPLPRRPRITAVGLVNLRKSPGLKDISELMEDGWKTKKGVAAPWGNLMATYLLPLPVSPHSGKAVGGPSTCISSSSSSHAVETLLAVKRMCDSKKRSLEAHCTYVTGQLAMALTGPKGTALLLGRLSNQTTMAVSNMMGPIEQVSLAGNPISGIYPSVPPPYQALCCHFQSYNGQLRVVLFTSLENFPDPQELCACFIEAFEDLKSNFC